MRLTPTQLAILLHRLELADCLADCFSSELVGEPGYDARYNEVESAASDLCLYVRRNGCWPDALTPLQLEILVDCLEGSTWFADEEDAIARGDLTKSKSRTAHKAADELETILSGLAGYGVVCASH